MCGISIHSWIHTANSPTLFPSEILFIKWLASTHSPISNQGSLTIFFSLSRCQKHLECFTNVPLAKFPFSHQSCWNPETKHKALSASQILLFCITRVKKINKWMAKQIVFETDNTICSPASYVRFPPAANIYSRVLTLSKSACLCKGCNCLSYSTLDNAALRKKK